MIIGYIYKIENTLNGKRYIGQTTYSIDKRWRNHVNAMNQERAYNYPLYRAFRKYGVENFTISILEKVEDNSLLDEREKYWIAFFDSYKKGYNATYGGS